MMLVVESRIEMLMLFGDCMKDSKMDGRYMYQPITVHTDRLEVYC